MSQIEITQDGIAGEASHRMLHFFWLVDYSYSMSGAKIQKVNWAIRDVLPEIRKLEDSERLRIRMAAIKFGETAGWHVGPNPASVTDFEWTDLNATGSATATAQAIEMLIEALDVKKIGGRNVPPVCILLSDGYCTDSTQRYAAAIQKLDDLPWGKKAVRLSIGIAEREGDYNKEELDMFVSPWLRTERQIETLHADTPRKLMEYIEKVSTVAVKSASSSRSDTQNSGSTTPVDINPAQLTDPFDVSNVKADEEW